MTTPRVAIVHDHLVQRGGAERVVLSMLRAFPGATVHTSLFDSKATYPDLGSADVRPSWLNRMGLLRADHRRAFPLMAPIFSTRRIDADLVLASSSGWSHGVRTEAPKLVYCYSPARWLYQGSRYLGNEPSARMLALRALGAPLRRWDRRAAASADRYLTLSTWVRDQIRELYGIDAEVLPPPMLLDVLGDQVPPQKLEPGFFLCVARLLPYKNVQAVVDAFRQLPASRLVVAGSGPLEQQLRAAAGPKTTILGGVEEAELRWLYANCEALVTAAYEDYGLTPIEGLAFGKPAAVLRYGGFLDTVLEEVTGVFFDRPDPADIAAAVRRLNAANFRSSDLSAHALQFDEARFIARLRKVVDDTLAGR